MTYQGYIDTDLYESRARMADACGAAIDEIDAKLRTYERKGVLKLWEMGDARRLSLLRKEINKTMYELWGMIELETVQVIESAFYTGSLWAACTIDGAVGGLGFAFAGVNRNLLEASVNRKIAGLTVSDRLSQKRLNLLWHERDAIATTQILGYGANKTAREIILEDAKHNIETSFSRAMTIARTETTRNATAGVMLADIDAHNQGIETRSKWRSGGMAKYPHTPSHTVYNGKVADHWSDEHGKYVFMIDGKPSEGPGHCESTDHNFGCKCCMTTLCVGYEEFYPTDEDFKKFSAKYKTSAVKAA